MVGLQTECHIKAMKESFITWTHMLSFYEIYYLLHCQFDDWEAAGWPCPVGEHTASKMVTNQNLSHATVTLEKTNVEDFGLTKVIRTMCTELTALLPLK